MEILAPHSAHACDELGRDQVRPQLLHHGKASRDVGIGFSKKDFHGKCFHNTAQTAHAKVAKAAKYSNPLRPLRTLREVNQSRWKTACFCHGRALAAARR